MTYVQVHCPDCQGIDVVRYGKQRHGPQRYRCNNTDCPRHIFLLHYQHQGRLPAVKQQMVDMALNGSGIRDTARVLRVSPTTVITTLKKKSQAYSTSMKGFSSVLILSQCRSSSTR
jgi:insertion element IS1 protein InsB